VLIFGAGGVMIWLQRGGSGAAPKTIEVVTPSRRSDAATRPDGRAAAVSPDAGVPALKVAKTPRKPKRAIRVGTRKAKKRKHGLEGTVDPFAR
jgi:hypothetical protein